MKEIKWSIPDGCKNITVKIDGDKVIAEFRPEQEKFELKDGDIVTDMDGVVAIYAGTNETGGIIAYAGYLDEEHRTTTEKGCGWGLTKYFRRYATESEKQRLFDALAKVGKRWNPETKQIEDLPRWRAKKGGVYYYISENKLEVDYIADEHGLTDDNYYNSNNYFKTREAAERVAEQIREIFKKSKAE